MPFCYGQLQDTLYRFTLLQRHQRCATVKRILRIFKECKHAPAIRGTQCFKKRLNQLKDLWLKLPFRQLETSAQIRNAYATVLLNPSINRYARHTSQLCSFFSRQHIGSSDTVFTELRT